MPQKVFTDKYENNVALKSLWYSFLLNKLILVSNDKWKINLTLTENPVIKNPKYL